MVTAEKVAEFLAEPRNVIIAGIRRNGRPHLSPNWFYWDGQKFYVSTTRQRMKYAIFRDDPRAELIVDDSTGARYVRIPATVQVCENLAAQLPKFRAIREKQGVQVPPDPEFLAWLTAENRVLLAMVPDKPMTEWAIHGLD